MSQPSDQTPDVPVLGRPGQSAEAGSFSLDPVLRRWLVRIDQIEAEIGQRPDASPVQRRAWALELGDRLFDEFGRPGPAGVEVRTHSVATFRVREYRPVDPNSNAGATRLKPAYLLLHGGAFWLSSIDERINAALAAERAVGADVVVFDVDYRLAPEHPFPAGLEDCHSALVWVYEHAVELGVDPDRIVVGGVSAGGNLAAALCQLARRRGGPPICGQLLEVPALDLRPDGTWLEEYAAINGLSDSAEMRDFYLPPGQDPADPLVSPLAATDLTGLPPAHIMTAEIDPFRAGGEAYAVALRQAGVPVSASRQLGNLHGGNGLAGAWVGARLWANEVAAALRHLAA
ncbi:MAG: alpha/beta hydrolase [Propionibacteriaceae bacterium]|jgi:acetyl esterase|nr:alpha/beta hydrolase [Propionibacteriaceae bacterium]